MTIKQSLLCYFHNNDIELMHHLHHQLIRKQHQDYAAITNRAKAKPCIAECERRGSFTFKPE